MEDAEIDLRRLFGLVRRRIFAILATTLACAGLALAAAMLVAPQYSATSLVVFDPQRKDLLDPSAPGATAIADNVRIESEVELLRSDTVLLKVIADQNLADKLDMSPGLRARALATLGLQSLPQLSSEDRQLQALARLRRAVNIERRGPTYLIGVTVKSADPDRAADLANSIAQTYIDNQIASKVETMLASRDVLQARLSQARAEIVTSEAAFNQFLGESIDQLAASADGGGVHRLNSELSALSQAREQADARASLLKASLAGQDWKVLQTVLGNKQAMVLDQQRQAFAHGAAYAETDELATQHLQSELVSLEQSADAELASLRTTIAAMDQQQAILRQQLRDEVLQSDLPAPILTGLFDLQSKAAFAQEQYQALINRSLQLGNQAELQVPDSRIASPALSPSAPFFPNRSVFLALGAALGMVAGLGGSLVYESVVGGFISREQMEASLRTRVAATLPRIKLPLGNDTLADLVITAPLSEFAEAMRRTRLAADDAAQSMPSGEGRILMVTSAVLGEGKTTTALALARSYALSGRRTLLIDCDLRQPRIAAELGMQAPMGLLDMLTAHPSRFDLRAGIARESDTGLSLLMSAHGSDRPTDTVLAGAPFARLVSEAARLFEVVVLDTPPVEPVVDALYIAPRADTIVLVSRWASTSQREIKQTLASLTQAKRPSVQILSILNGTNQAKPGRKQIHDHFYDADQAWSFARLPADHSMRPVPPHAPLASQPGNVIGLHRKAGDLHQ
ncbi:GumC family protein [Devosia submarina]|uniref:GumC family protein n=1 Tax=Devosia submarina TaxID=1173082 RepID=UPI000D36BEF6|nr:Wzz/FepE/Etk N-terminal domain-containing protein [Devosia submarina]